ncbi:MAG: urea carboxylase [Pseudomonadota bacterium]
MRAILVANRGEIACRIIGTVQRMGLAAIAVYSDADRHAAHVRLADRAVRLGPPPAAQSYLNIEAILAAAAAEGADAIHPGYGFLSESSGFAERVVAAGMAFIGPDPAHLALFGEKHAARQAAAAAGVPLVAGSDLLATLEEAEAAANTIGFPLMLKSTAGGGGIGLKLCHSAGDLPHLFEAVQRASEANFGDGRLFAERFIENARHVEVQIFGDGQRVIALGERDCSLQRRNQKVIEEAPAPDLPKPTRQAMADAAVALGASVGYRTAGTVEFIYDPAENTFSFLEVNTRLQVEHPVTEAVTGIDLVEWMIRAAAGTLDLSAEQVTHNGHAIEARLYAEDPANDFRPQSGTITHVTWPQNARVDTFVEPGSTVPPHYDPLLAKIIVHGQTRDEARAAMAAALSETAIFGIATNLDYLRDICGAPFFAAATVSTTALAGLDHAPPTVDVLSPGTQSTLQDWPGRLGAWHVGVPPSGPMDALSHRLANQIVGNPDGAAALELTLSGPTLRFRAPAVISLTGADMGATLDGEPVPQFTPVDVAAGATLALGLATRGMRAYLAVRGGFSAAPFLGSGATFTLGGFGGHGVGALKAGDVLRLENAPAGGPRAAPASPPLTNAWTLAVLYGPHGAPDYFTEGDIETLLGTAYRVGVNSARTGVRLEGPKPEFARSDGGEAGLHPSNIHDNAYAVGAIDFTGDMPIILGPDGPSLGGFVCPFVVALPDLWKLGQLRPGDTVRFALTTRATAVADLVAAEAAIQSLAPLPAPTLTPSLQEEAVRLRRDDRPIPVTYRRSGEDNILVEFGENVLDLALRVRAHTLMEAVHSAALPAIIDVTPGIRSLQIHYDSAVLSEAALLSTLDGLERDLPPPHAITVPSRTVHLPLAFDDSQTRLATERYQANVRPDAPWCPSNIEFIRRINGLDSVEDVRRIVFDAQYLVYGLGDVYLGAPVATPLDPRHRLVTTKYNPARTWTPENAVGIGGAYMCIYGMEGPGGYQFVGRTVQIWNTYRQTSAFRDGVPWLLRYFDKIRFYEVSEAELLEMREAFPYGGVDVAIEDGVLDMGAEAARLGDAGEEIAAFTATRTAAFKAERARWAEAGLTLPAEPPPPATLDLAAGTRTIDAPLSGVVWSLALGPGDRVEAGEAAAVLEAMKMEVPVAAGISGTIDQVLVAERDLVEAGAPLFTLVD